MTTPMEPKGAFSAARMSSKVRILDDADGAQDPDRRAFLRRLTVQGASLPAAYFMLGGHGAGAAVPGTEAGPATSARGKSAFRLPDDAGTARLNAGLLVRDFADPYIELVRLLREASEVEHALMVQYLYAAFSIKPDYESLAGYGDPNSDDLLGVAIEEMQHLGLVNRLLTELGAAPNLIREDFPYEPDVYPFAFNLEPLSRKSLAKYVWTEAPSGALADSGAEDPEHKRFQEELRMVLGKDPKPNHIGSLYSSVIATLEELITDYIDGFLELAPWIERLEAIKAEGEEGHYTFFKQTFMGRHEGFKGHPDIWSLSPQDPAYPAFPLQVNPSAYVGHENQIEDPAALSLAWLGNLHYWTVLLLLDCAYRLDKPGYIELSRQHMMGPIWSMARHLPKLGVGLPFDPLSMGYAPGLDAPRSLSMILHFLREAEQLEQQLAALPGRLPEDFPVSTCQETREVIQGELTALLAKHSVTL